MKASGGVRRALDYSLRYVSGLRAARKLCALGPLSGESAYAIAQHQRWRGDRLSITQSRDEILALLELLSADPPRVVIEIGLDQGGTLFVWTQVASEDAALISIDNRPLGLLGRWSAFAVARRRLARGSQRIDLVVPADSHDVRTLARVKAILAGRSADFLFIDGDHSYEGVRLDFEMYAPLVRPGGIVAFHDVLTPAEPHVVRFWDDFKREHETSEYSASSGERYGIGIYRVPRGTW